MTIVMSADDAVRAVIKQLDKLLDVKAIKEIPQEQGTLREIALVKVNMSGIGRVEFMKEVSGRGGIVLDIGETTATVQFTGTTSFINECVEMLRAYGIVEMARTGMVALERGDTRLIDCAQL